ncbi:response regulator [Kineobactrum salinum]|uniref:Response regulator n=1 Tax=Kineobactrum salinum TaxID=2708301 RepID=A0A6C0U8A8_9GAMM|nr:response regulator [Kineobactrum salinum]QIB65744.1 response regulator [Kineobactrum salinum]
MGRRILVIEDHADNLDLMVYLLGAFGYRVSTARNGREGLDCAARERPDVIICDIQMPVMDGYQVIHELKHNPDLAAIPVIAVTAFAMPGDRQKVMAAGFDGCFTKPIDAETFVQQMREFIPQGPQTGTQSGSHTDTGCEESGHDTDS